MAKPDLNEYDDASKTAAPNAAKIEHQEADGSPSDWEPSWEQDDKGPPKTVVFDGNDEILLEYFRHVDGPYEGGAMPETPTAEDLETPRYRRASFQLDIAARIATWAVTEARRRLPHGPLNQAFHFAGDAPDGPASYVMGNAAPAYYENLLELMTGGLSYFPGGTGGEGGGMACGFERLLANFFATVSVGAGVCANISALTAGLATLTALPTWQVEGVTTTILRCSHNAGHSFVAIAYGESPFVVADPWMAEPRLVLLEDNDLAPSGIKTYEKIVVHRRLDAPFGIPLVANWPLAAPAPTVAVAPVQNLMLTQTRIAMAKVECRVQRVDDAQLEDMRSDPTVPLFQANGKANPDVKRINNVTDIANRARRNFHANECLAAKGKKQFVVWEYISNDPRFPGYARDGSPGDPPPIHTVDEWGDDAKHDFAAGTVAPPPGPPPKGKAEEVA